MLEDRGTARSSSELRVIAGHAARDLDGAPAEEILTWAAEAFGQLVLLSQSMTRSTLSTMVLELGLGIRSVFVDTGFHFEETLWTRDEVLRVGQQVVTVASDLSVADQAKAYGADLWKSDPDLCCALRKVEPLDRALEGMEAWVTGLRRTQSDTRKQVLAVSFDEVREIVMVAPLVSWSDEMVVAYGREHSVQDNPLIAAGYPSIGCWLCTRAVAEASEHSRAGRWDGFDKTECGIHDLRH